MNARVQDFLAEQLATRPEAPALSDASGAAWSYADLDRARVALAAELRSAGVQAGDRVLLMVENCVAAVASLYAAWELDAVAIPVNARQTEAEVTRIIDRRAWQDRGARMSRPKRRPMRRG